jgi:O-antigen/teichoic acid export membrane protein
MDTRQVAPEALPAEALPPFDDAPAAGAHVHAAPATWARAAAARNFIWLMLDKALGIFFGLAVFGLIARSFGSAASGHFAYALALLQSALGLSLVCSAAVLLPRIYRMRNGVAATLANVFIVRMIGSVLAAVGAAMFALIAIADAERLRITLLVLLAVPLIEPFYTAVVYWQSRNDNRRPTLCRAAGLMTRAAVVILAILLGAPLWVVAFAWVMEAAVSATLLYSSVRPLAPLRMFIRRVSVQRSLTYMRFGVRFLLGLWLSNVFLRLDRLVLGGLLPAPEFGVYASAMQLVDVWLQVAYLTGFAIGPVFLYKALASNARWQIWRMAALLAGLGCIGLLGALLFGDLAMQLVFGQKFVAGAPYLIAGTAFGILVFVDQILNVRVTAGNRPLALAVKWAVACLCALAVQAAAYHSVGAYAGPLGLAVGVVCGWLAQWAALWAAPAQDFKRVPA